MTEDTPQYEQTPTTRPTIALTMGDVTGVGPEVIVKAWSSPKLHQSVRPLVIGRSEILQRAINLIQSPAQVQRIQNLVEASPTTTLIPCLDVGQHLSTVPPAQIDPRAGRASYDFLVKAIDLALDDEIDAICTLPLHKEALDSAGINVPGHTEILAERCHVANHAMMLYLPPSPDFESKGLGVVHATLHVPLRRVFDLLTIPHLKSILMLTDFGLRPLLNGRTPRIAVAGLNPHAGEHGLFGDEESTIIEPAIDSARAQGVDVHGPIAADTLFARALDGEFDAVIAMYHDQGHVALKTIGFDRAVNVTLGLPIVRTSVAHGTAFDIAWTGQADPTSLFQAIDVAAKIVQGRQARP